MAGASRNVAGKWLWISMAFPLAIIAKLVSNRLDLWLAGPLAYIISCIVALAAVATCVWRGMRGAEYREGWLALALAISCAAISVMFLTVTGFLNQQNVDAMIPLSLLVLYGTPIIFVMASPPSNPVLARIIDGLAAIVLSALVLVFIAHLLQPNERLDASGAMTVEAMFDIQNIYIALFALARFLASRKAGERSFFGALTLYGFAHVISSSICNRIARLLPINTDLNIFYDLSYLLLAGLAICFFLPSRSVQGRDRIERLVRVGIPFALPLSILTLSIALAPYHLVAALAGCTAALVLFALRTVVAQLHSLDERDEFAKLSRYDGLTGLPNRRYFDMRIGAELARGKRPPNGLAVLMIDIDHFKILNDTLGHCVGDERLREVANALRGQAARETDLVARYGGEEFIAMLPEMSEAQALTLAEKMRAAVEALALPSPAPRGHVTVSIGVAWASSDALSSGERSSAEQLIEHADQALYRSKHADRNRVTAAWIPD